MVDATQAVIRVTVPTIAILVGILINDRALTKFRRHMGSCFDALEQRLLEGTHKEGIPSGQDHIK